MNIKRIEFEVDGRVFFLVVKRNMIVFSNDLEVVGRFNRTRDALDQAAEQIFEFCNGFSPTYGDVVEYTSLLTLML